MTRNKTLGILRAGLSDPEHPARSKLCWTQKQEMWFLGRPH